MKKFKNWLIPIGLATSTFVPLAFVVSCGDSDKIVNIPPSSRSDDDIAKDLSSWSQDAALVSAFSPITSVTPDQAKLFWNKPGGESIRVAAITSVLGSLWKKGSNDVISAIIKGVETIRDSADDYPGYVNEYKLYLLNNIRSFLEKNGIYSSMQKFDGFLHWFIDSSHNYANLKQVLLGGEIDKKFVMGVQDDLNDGVTNDKKVYVFAEEPAVVTPTSPVSSSTSGSGTGSSTTGSSTSGSSNSNATTDSNEVTPIHTSAFSINHLTTQQVNDWIQAKYNLLKPQMDTNQWVKEDVPNLDKFKEYLLSTDSSVHLPTTTNGVDKTAAEVGEMLRTYLVEATLGSIWGVNPVDSDANIITIGIGAFGIAALNLKANIATEEQKHLGSFEEYASFLDWMINPQEHYSNLRSLCQNPPDSKMNLFQEGFRRFNTDTTKAHVDIFA